MVVERDVYVPMRDGVRLCVDIYRPPADEPVPALLAFAVYNKDIQGPEAAAALAAPAGVVAAVDRPAGGRRYPLLRLARLRARDRHAAGHR